jgi:hypothetical protein
MRDFDLAGYCGVKRWVVTISGRPKYRTRKLVCAAAPAIRARVCCLVSKLVRRPMTTGPSALPRLNCSRVLTLIVARQSGPAGSDGLPPPGYRPSVRSSCRAAQHSAGWQPQSRPKTLVESGPGRPRRRSQRSLEPRSKAGGRFSLRSGPLTAMNMKARSSSAICCARSISVRCAGALSWSLCSIRLRSAREHAILRRTTVST